MFEAPGHTAPPPHNAVSKVATPPPKAVIQLRAPHIGRAQLVTYVAATLAGVGRRLLRECPRQDNARAIPGTTASIRRAREPGEECAVTVKALSTRADHVVAGAV